MNVDYRDKSKAVTAEDLIRRYNLDGLSKDRKAIKTLNDGLTKQDTIIEEYVRNTTKYVTNQVDNFVTTWFFSGTPTLENKPFIDFSEDEKSSHVEDVYYDKETGYIYQLRLNNDVYSWELIDDDNLRNSLAIANSSADASDNKRNLYYSTPYPPYQVGDVWYSDGLIKRCRSTRSSGNMNELDWVFQSEYSDSSAIMDTTAVVNQFKEYAEKNYVTNSTLETTKESIYGYVGAETTVINDQILQMKTTDEITDDYKLEIFNASEAEVLKLRICGEMSLLYPSDYLYPSDDLYPLDSYLIIENTQGEKSKYPLAINYLNYLNEMVFDEYILENGKQKIIRRVGIDDNSQLVALEDPITENYEDLDIILNEGYNKVYLESFSDKDIKYEMYYIIKTNYTQAIATKVITESKILQTAKEINLEVSKKVDENEIIASINLTSEEAKINASKITLEGIVTANQNFKVLLDGSIEAKNGTFSGDITSNNAVITGGSLTIGSKFKVTNDGTLTATNGNFNGTITSSNATITGGSLTIGSKFKVTNDGTLTATNGNFNGTITSSNATITGGSLTIGSKFKVTNDGTLTATGGTFSGNITASSGKIGTWTINSAGMVAQDSSGKWTGIRLPNGESKAYSFFTGATANNGANASFVAYSDGSLYANNASIRGSITSSRISGSTITGGSIKIEGTGFFTFGTGTTHPWASAINVTGLYGVNFYTGRTASSVGSQQAYIDMGGSNGALQMVSLYTDVVVGGYHVKLSAREGNVYASRNNGTNYLVSTDGGNISSLNLKENIKIFDDSEYEKAYKLLQKIDIYRYDYKYKISDNKKEYGFIIDYIEKNNNYDEFLYFYNQKANVENNELDYLIEKGDNNIIEFKKYDSENLLKYLFTLIKVMQIKIDKLEGMTKNE